MADCIKPRRTRLGSPIVFTKLYNERGTYPLVYIARIRGQGLFRIAPADHEPGCWMIDRYDGLTYEGLPLGTFARRSDAAQALADHLGI